MDFKGNFFSKCKACVFDFDGVFTDNRVWTDSFGTESVACWRSDGIGLKMLDDLGIYTHVISTETNEVVRVRCEKLGIAVSYGVKEKRGVLVNLINDWDLHPAEVCFVGNDINDLSAFDSGVFSVAVSDSYDLVKKRADFVLRRPGGFGAVREVCDLIREAYDRENGSGNTRKERVRSHTE